MTEFTLPVLSETRAHAAALGAAFCWAIGSLVAADATRALGGIAFTRIREYLVLAMLLPVVVFGGTTLAAFEGYWSLLALSGFIGIFIGDSALFVTMSRLGPRRTGMLFATNAPMTLFLSWLLLEERLGWIELFGSGLVVSGVLIAIARGRRRDSMHGWETTSGSLALGIGFGLAAAFGQSAGSLLAAPALDAGLDPVAVATLRIAVATLAMIGMAILLPEQARARNPMTPTIFLRVFVSGLVGMAIGMTLLLYAFAHGQVGLSATLSSTTPVMLLPLIWWLTRERPNAGAWIGAVLAVLGTTLIVAL